MLFFFESNVAVCACTDRHDAINLSGCPSKQPPLYNRVLLWLRGFQAQRFACQKATSCVKKEREKCTSCICFSTSVRGEWRWMKPTCFPSIRCSSVFDTPVHWMATLHRKMLLPWNLKSSSSSILELCDVNQTHLYSLHSSSSCWEQI